MKVFFSFHFAEDSWRASMVRQIGALEGNQPVSGNDWEQVKRGGDDSIANWIRAQMVGRKCAIVLVGAQTARRPWVRFEIETAWNKGVGIMGVRINGLEDSSGRTSAVGANPFDSLTLNGRPLSNVVRLYTPSGFYSKGVYATIASNLETWVDEAVRTRSSY
ncbi:TIR domain-containing protein [Paraburkholderia sp. 32]|uniref:TIR domain-containing protein n=1 Tax=Paraburkholderia sp. 32 TaxID=2991057 RepID=UPI003D206BF6